MTYIVAELGINHNGNPHIAHRMIDKAAQCGVDAVKVQSYRVEDIPWRTDIQTLAKRCEIWPYLRELRDHAKEVGVEFGGTPTSLDGIQELDNLDVDFLKNGSDFLPRTDLIQAMLDTGIWTMVSTGMATGDDLRAICHLQARPPHNLTPLHCTSAYPCSDQETNLLRILPGWGFSDHTKGITAAVAAAALGATVIEKHFTLDRKMEGPDQRFSLEPPKLAKLVREVRRVEQMLGTPEIAPTESELKTRDLWRHPEVTHTA